MNVEFNDTKSSILIVDDNEEILEFLADDLGEHYEVFTANNVKVAFEILENQLVELIISDIIMPETDGYTFCNMVRNNIQYSHMPFIMLTAKNTLHSRIEGLEKGADAYIEKPFSPEHLQVQISSLLTNRNRIKHFFSSYPNSSQTKVRSVLHEKFMAKVNACILQNIDEPTLDVDQLASHLCMSRPTLYRKLKEVVNLAPNELINITRLKKATELLLSGQYSVNEIALLVGFSSSTHFGRNFVKQFGVTPSQYAFQNKND
ncbi:MAG: two-component system response regulator [Pseudopedobacter saltans]|uniref:Two-component system response regulator n=1 Tax=Pseudopedobacter saltans TaxID=151895 RepID=A0A2W5GX26_9SPHI|nr:MAG: two-component system response regulator [Pseudopedobacter saltans]